MALLQFTGAIHSADPLWYRLFRAGVAIVEAGIGAWMVWTYRQHAEPGAGGKEGAETGALRRTSREAVVRNRPRRHPGADSLPTRRGRNHGRP